MRDLSKSVFYFRCSTQAQVDRDSTLGHYFDKAYKIGFKDHQIIYDVGSGGNSERGGYLQIKELASLGLIDAIVLPDDLSRLTRDLAEFQIVKKLLLDTNVKLLNMSFREYRFDTPEDDLQQNLLMSFAEFQRKLNQYKSVQGHKYLRDKGKAIRALFPYVKQNGTLYPNNAEYKRTGKSVWEIGLELVEAYIQGGSAEQAIKTMVEKYGEGVHGQKRWEDFCRSSTGFKTWIKCELIRGNIEYHAANHIAYGTHQPLLTKDQISRIDKMVDVGAREVSSKFKVFNIWKSVAICANCQHRMRILCKTKTTRYGKYQYRWLVCSEGRTNNQSKLRRIRTGHYTPECDRSHHYFLSYENFKDLTIDALVSKSQELANNVFKEPVKLIPKEVETLRKQIDKYKVLAEDDPDLLPLLNKKQLQLNRMLEESESREEFDVVYARKALAEFGAKREFWELLTQKELTVLINEFIDRAVCDEGEVTFFFKV